MHPEETTVTTALNGKPYKVELGVRSMALGAITNSSDRDLLFNPEAGHMHYSIDGKLARADALGEGDFTVSNAEWPPSGILSDTKFSYFRFLALVALNRSLHPLSSTPSPTCYSLASLAAIPSSV